MVVVVVVVQVIYLSLALHRRDDVYKNALQFNPDRWNNDVAKPPRFMSFHGGPRICLGQDMAYLGTGSGCVAVRLCAL